MEDWLQKNPPKETQIKVSSDYNPLMDQKTFDALHYAVRNDIRILISSDNSVYYDNPAFIAMIDAGLDVVPFIFKQYEKEYDWMCPMVLTAVLQVNPVKRSSRGRCNNIREDWLEWGRANGYVKAAK